MQLLIQITGLLRNLAIEPECTQEFTKVHVLNKFFRFK